jgi:hypothetical protein
MAIRTVALGTVTEKKLVTRFGSFRLTGKGVLQGSRRSWSLTQLRGRTILVLGLMTCNQEERAQDK